MGHGTFLRFILIAAMIAGVGGCGRKGPLELPSGAPDQQSSASGPAQQQRILGNADAGLIQNPNAVVDPSHNGNAQQAAKPIPRPINGPTTARRNTFFLDPLL